MKTFLRRTALPLALTLAAAAAPITPRLGAQPTPAGEIELQSSVSYSAESDMKDQGPNAGELSVTGVTLNLKSSSTAGEHLVLGYGLDYEYYDLGTSGNVFPLPGELQAVALDLSATYSIDRQWSVTGSISPGFYTAGTRLDSDALNVPVLLLANWRYNAGWAFVFGVRYDSFSDNELLPFAGIRWQASPELTVTLGAPRSEIVYAYAEGREVYAGASFQGGSFYVDSVAPALSSARLSDTKIDYREIRLGVGTRLNLRRGLGIELEGGWMLDRRFDYHERGREVKTDGAPYVQGGLSVRF